MSNDHKPLEEQLLDAAYTAVGAGILAYQLSRPHRQRAAQALRSLHDQHGDHCRQRLDMAGTILRPACNIVRTLADEGRNARRR